MPNTDFPKSPLPADDYALRLFHWFDENGRHDLPWQRNKTPYRVWVSEIMLQQTQVATVIPYFERFTTAFPNVTSLANAHEDEVLHLWTGLGYYARARNLHKAAKQCRDEHNGQLPHTLEGLNALPGIGCSTAGAILSIAYNQRAPILDGNVRRLLTRFLALQSPPSAKFERQLWTIADQLTPDYRHADYTQLVMDMGATLCKRSQPDCHRCPLQDACLAHQQGIETQLPIKKKRKTIPVKSAFMILLQQADGSFLLEKRPPSGIWGGLWCPPECGTQDAVNNWLAQHQITAAPQQQATFRHTFSHFHLDITPVLLQNAQFSGVNDAQQRWAHPQQLEGMGLAAPVKKLLLRQK